MNELNIPHDDEAVQAIAPLSTCEADQVGGGMRIVAPSGAVYYISYGRIGVEDPTTGTSHWL